MIGGGQIFIDASKLRDVRCHAQSIKAIFSKGVSWKSWTKKKKKKNQNKTQKLKIRLCSGITMGYPIDLSNIFHAGIRDTVQGEELWKASSPPMGTYST